MYFKLHEAQSTTWEDPRAGQQEVGGSNCQLFGWLEGQGFRLQFSGDSLGKVGKDSRNCKQLNDVALFLLKQFWAQPLWQRRRVGVFFHVDLCGSHVYLFGYILCFIG